MDFDNAVPLEYSLVGRALESAVVVVVVAADAVAAAAAQLGFVVVGYCSFAVSAIVSDIDFDTEGDTAITSGDPLPQKLGVV